MKRTVKVVLVIALILSIASPGYCGAGRKLMRGLSNLITCPLELPNRMRIAVKEEKNLVEVIGIGLPKGLGMMIMRGCFGLYETLSFPIPIPENYEPMITDPEFFWKSEKSS